jgi:hypothetical protein
MISFGSIEHSNFEMLSTIEPAAPSDEAPAVRPVALTSFASRPVKVRLRTPKVRSQVRAVMSKLLVLQTTESAVTEIVLLGVKPKLVLPPKSRAIIRLSKARTNGDHRRSQVGRSGEYVTILEVACPLSTSSFAGTLKMRALGF